MAENKNHEEMELKIFRDFLSNLTTALKELEVKEPEAPPVEAEKENDANVQRLEGEVAQLRSLLQALQVNNTPPQNQFQAIPGNATVFISPAPALPYIKTPDYAPVIPTTQAITTSQGEKRDERNNHQN